MTQPPRTPFADIARGATPTAPPRVAHEQLKPYVEEGTPDINVSKWTHEIVPEGERCPIERERSESEVTSWSDRPRRQRKRRHHRKRL